jgi:hypothetical protein
VKTFCTTTYEYAERSGLERKFKKETKMNAKDCMTAFFKRKNLPLCHPENTSLGRDSGFNRVLINTLFANLKTTFEEKKISASLIYNI